MITAAPPGPYASYCASSYDDAGLFARAAADRPLDVVGGHVGRLGVGDDRPQPRVHVGIAAAGPGRDGQFLDEAREDLAALGVGGALLVLDRVPLGMAGHVRELQGNRGNTRQIYETARQIVTTRVRRARMIHTSAPRVPGAAAVVAEHGVHAEAGAFEAAPSSAAPRACGTSARSACSAVAAAAPLDVAAARRSSAGAPRSWRTDSTSVRWAPPAARPRSWTRFVYSRQFGTSGTRSMPKVPPGARTRATDVERRRSGRASRTQRLQDAVRREHHRERAGRERQRADVAAHERARRSRDPSARIRRRARLARAVEHRRRTDRCRRARRRRARAAATRGRCRSRARARGPSARRPPRGARTARRAARASARSPSRRTARTRPSLQCRDSGVGIRDSSFPWGFGTCAQHNISPGAQIPNPQNPNPG